MEYTNFGYRGELGTTASGKMVSKACEPISWAPLVHYLLLKVSALTFMASNRSAVEDSALRSSWSPPCFGVAFLVDP